MPSTAKPSKRRWLGVSVFLAALAVLLPGALLITIDVGIWLATRERIHDELARVPPAPVALVLGTSHRQRGRPNLFYGPRIQAAADLYHAGRVRAILVSGDNATRYYNEPWTMRRDLIAAGVPADYITLDYAGFRTLDSMVRAKAVFSQKELIIVSQRFHAARALYIAERAGLNAIAYAAADPPLGWYLPIRVREVFARTLAVLDLLTGRSPRFLGNPEPVPLRPEPSPALLDESPCPTSVSPPPSSS